MALALRARGASLLGFTSRSAAGRAEADSWLGGRASSDLAELVLLQPELYLVAVPDQALPEVAEPLGAAFAAAPPTVAGDAARPVVAHTSGATSVSVLSSCQRAGATTLVFHPLQTFSDPLTGSSRFAGAAVAVTPVQAASDSPAAAFGFALAQLLGARPFLLPDDKRSLYHAAATVACNYLVTLEHHADRLFTLSGLPREESLSLFLPLVRATLDNVAAQGTVAALTGPLSRGDTATIAGHLAALATDTPDLLVLYRALGHSTLDLVRARGELPPAAISELAEILGPRDRPAGAQRGRPGE
ncbi:MAG: hypothetical protein A2133_01355 [Actinobacteria bacterium RBG_16_64_13]|nr:MAG: hypothetical protein A2133_01355 [Actinobacteria bacterium RBG_16_64_13]